MDRYIIAIGGGDLRQKETLKIDGAIASLAKKRAGEKRAYALFIGTASHDSMPYYNTFHKTYTGELGLKTDCALTVYGEMDYDKIKGKFEKADMIYVGGGDTLYMIEKWRESGIYDLIIDAYNRGVIISGLSAGGICWFSDMFTDSEMVDKSGAYSFAKGMGIVKGCACPHYNERKTDLISCENTLNNLPIFAIENNSAIVLRNELLVGSLTCGGNAFILNNENGTVSENIIKSMDLSEFF